MDTQIIFRAQQHHPKLGLHSPFNHTYCHMDYSLHRKVIHRRAHMQGPRDRKNQVYSTLRLAKSLFTNPQIGSLSPHKLREITCKREKCKCSNPNVSALHWSGQYQTVMSHPWIGNYNGGKWIFHSQRKQKVPAQISFTEHTVIANKMSVSIHKVVPQRFAPILRNQIIWYLRQ